MVKYDHDKALREIEADLEETIRGAARRIRASQAEATYSLYQSTRKLARIERYWLVLAVLMIPWGVLSFINYMRLGQWLGAGVYYLIAVIYAQWIVPRAFRNRGLHHQQAKELLDELPRDALGRVNIETPDEV